jgi:pimeloyl-ACP methyl ester carboxylesterase
VLAFDRRGAGPPLLLLHGTTSSRHVWTPLIDQLAELREVWALDLPGHGQSPATSHTPPDWAREVASFIDERELRHVAVLGHSAGGWTALELAKLGSVENVLALAPAGLWRARSPRLTDLALSANWHLGRLAPTLAVRALRSPSVRSLALRSISASPRAVPAAVAAANAEAALATDSFPRHFRETRRLRFRAGGQIDVPIKIVWGERDHIAPAAKSRSTDELPAHTEVETWAGCGHMLMWDAPERVVACARERFG